MKKVAILGASGLVGATLFEYLHEKGSFELVPVINSPGNAWRLSRHQVSLHQADLMCSDDLDRVLSGVDYVVNCTRGDNEFMLGGLENVIKACRRNKIRRLIHLSSIMVYGDPPVAETEDVTPPSLPAGSYAAVKAEQDEMIKKAAAQGVPSIVLVPPNISGPSSYFLLGLLNSVNAGRIALIDDGEAPICLVDVRNLCRAIELAMENGSPDGRRYFITDDVAVTWGDVVRDLQGIHGIQSPVETIGRDELKQIAKPADAQKATVVGSIKHLVSSDIREALRKDPFWAKVDRSIRKLVAKLGAKIESRFRLSIEGPEKIKPRKVGRPIDARLCAQQFRDVRPCIMKARTELGYSPLVDYQTSMAAFVSWYRQAHAIDGEFEELLRQLYE